MAVVSHLPVASSSGSFLITPNVGLMIWTLLLFGISMYILWKLAFPRISDALDRRQHAIEESIDHAEQIAARGRRAARRVPRAAERGARAVRGDPRPRAQDGRGDRTPAQEQAEKRREQLMEQTRREIEGETRRAIQEIRREVADLTVMATEKVTRKVLDDDDQRRLVEDALASSTSARWRREMATNVNAQDGSAARAPRSRS